MNMIVTVDRNWGLSWNHQPLVRIPSEYRFIQNQTTGKVVVMDYDTLRPFPGEKAIGGRTTIVMRPGGRPVDPGVVTVSDLSELAQQLEQYNSESVYICGGESIYKQYMAQCDTVYVTWVDYEYRAESFFQNLDQSEDWTMVEESEEQTYYDLEYYVRTYARTKNLR